MRNCKQSDVQALEAVVGAIDQLALATGYDTNIVNKYLDASNTQVPLAPVTSIS